MKRLQQQQKDCLDEVSRREKAIQKLELEILKAQEQARLAQDGVRNDLCIYEKISHVVGIYVSWFLLRSGLFCPTPESISLHAV